MTVVPGTAEISPATPTGRDSRNPRLVVDRLLGRRDILGGELYSLLGRDNDAADRA